MALLKVIFIEKSTERLMPLWFSRESVVSISLESKQKYVENSGDPPSRTRLVLEDWVCLRLNNGTSYEISSRGEEPSAVAEKWAKQIGVIEAKNLPQARFKGGNASPVIDRLREASHAALTCLWMASRSLNIRPSRVRG